MHTLQLSNERLEQEFKIQEERLHCQQALEKQRHELDRQKQTAESGNNLSHLQEIMKIAQEEAERYRTENELLQRSL